MREAGGWTNDFSANDGLITGGEVLGHSFSASSISAMNQRLDSALAQLADRQLAEAFRHLILGC